MVPPVNALGRIAEIEHRLGVRRPSGPTATAPNGLASMSPHATGVPPTARTGHVSHGGTVGTSSFADEMTRATLRQGPGAFTTSTGACACAPGAAPSLGRPSGSSGSVRPDVPYAELFETAGERWGIDPVVLAAVGHVESRFRNDAVSKAGAVGVMQFLPSTAASLGVDPVDPASAIDGAARYLRQLQDRFGSLEVALGAYNVGQGSIARAGGVLVPGSQSERYARAVLDARGVVT